mmetsp:Transcript_16432/g.26861  ORF Transcript_16432/g.26861 Transcript_16432/m.26861 type:complete len:82 (+) Transcript_16432:499-744(+)
MTPRRIATLSDLSKLARLSLPALPLLDPPLIMATVNGEDRGLGVRRALLLAGEMFLVGGLGTAAAGDEEEDAATSLTSSSL